MGLERYYQAVDFLAAHSVEQEGFHAGQILDMYEEAVEKGGVAGGLPVQPEWAFEANPFAITSGSGEKDLAWEFLKLQST